MSEVVAPLHTVHPSEIATIAHDVLPPGFRYSHEEAVCLFAQDPGWNSDLEPNTWGEVALISKIVVPFVSNDENYHKYFYFFQSTSSLNHKYRKGVCSMCDVILSCEGQQACRNHIFSCHPHLRCLSSYTSDEQQKISTTWTTFKASNRQPSKRVVENRGNKKRSSVAITEYLTSS